MRSGKKIFKGIIQLLTGAILLNAPSRQKCASNNGVSESDIGVKKWTVEDTEDLEEISYS
jgi:hypothetical protein